MILGVALIVGGYSVIYWGIHHFQGVDCPEGPDNCRYSLFELLGFPGKWNLKGKPQGEQLVGAYLLSDPSQTQPVSGSLGSSSGGLVAPGGSGWENAILSGINAPTSQNNINKMVAWNQCEGNEAGHSGLGINNPFNITADSYQAATHGTGAVNSAGVQSFSSLALGVAGTVAKMSEPFCRAIVANLQQDGTGQAFANAVGSSGWGTNGGCIYQALQAGVTSGGAPSPQPGGPGVV